MRSILLVEDEQDIQFANRILLERKGGYAVRLAMNLAEARRSIEEAAPDVILLDINLPDGSGLDLLNELRERNMKIPVLLLTALSETSDELIGIQAGGDDYITKPYDNNVLLARLDAIMSRSESVPDNVKLGSLKLETYSNQAFINGENLQLTVTEFKVLLLMAQNEDRLLKAEVIYEKVWGQPMVGDTSAVQTAISRLRTKLESSGYDIEMLRGKGYIFTKI